MLFQVAGGVAAAQACVSEGPQILDFVLVLTILDGYRLAVKHDVEVVEGSDDAETPSEAPAQRFAGPLELALHVREGDPGAVLYVDVVGVDRLRVVFGLAPVGDDRLDLVGVHHEAMLDAVFDGVHFHGARYREQRQFADPFAAHDRPLQNRAVALALAALVADCQVLVVGVVDGHSVAVVFDGDVGVIGAFGGE